MLPNHIVKKRLLDSLKMLGVNTDSFRLVLKGYSKSLWGKYHPDRREIVLYIHKDSTGTLRGFEDLLESLIHEYVHHLQWTGKYYVRVKGIMHNEDFWKLYNHYMYLAVQNKLISEVVDEC